MAAAACPTTEVLNRYQLGQLATEGAEPVAAHLKDCPRCLELLAQLEKQGDGMLQRLRRVPPSFETDSDVYRQALAKVLSEPLMETKEQRPPSGLETPASTRLKPTTSSKRLPRPAEVVQLAAAMSEPHQAQRRGRRVWGWLGAAGMLLAVLLPLLFFWNPNRSADSTANALLELPFLAAANSVKQQQEWAARLRRPIVRQNGQQVELLLLPAGRIQFAEGSPLIISQPFEIGVYEITRRQFAAFLAEADSKSAHLTNAPPEGHTAEHPMVGISWEQAMAYCRWLSQKEQATYRLPTEGEWQLAAGLHFQDPLTAGVLAEQAWFAGNSGGRLRPVGQRRPNGWGLHDVLGNAAEWCHDGFGPLPSPLPKDYRGLDGSPLKTIRGGGFHREAEKQSDREGMPSSGTAPHLGFRIVCEVRSGTAVPPSAARSSAFRSRLDLSTLSAHRYP